MEHNILCALASSENTKVVVKNFKPEEDQHKALKHWLEDKQTVTPHPKGERESAVQSSQKRTNRKSVDSDDEDEDNSDESDEVVANEKKMETRIEIDAARFRRKDNSKAVTTVEYGTKVCKISFKTRR